MDNTIRNKIVHGIMESIDAELKEEYKDKEYLDSLLLLNQTLIILFLNLDITDDKIPKILRLIANAFEVLIQEHKRNVN